MFTLALILLTICSIDVLKEKMKNITKIAWYVNLFIIVVIMCYITTILGLDYEYHVILIGYFFYVFHEKLILAIPFSFLSIYKEPWTLLGFVLILTYNEERGKQNKILSYCFYPAHLLSLGILRMYLRV